MRACIRAGVCVGKCHTHGQVPAMARARVRSPGAGVTGVPNHMTRLLELSVRAAYPLSHWPPLQPPHGDMSPGVGGVAQQLGLHTSHRGTESQNPHEAVWSEASTGTCDLSYTPRHTHTNTSES